MLDAIGLELKMIVRNWMQVLGIGLEVPRRTGIPLCHWSVLSAIALGLDFF